MQQTFERMHIKQVIIDGFKSYANRTVINGWDPMFNAITGLNGSGKSNILDAICFVLGIEKLAQVRAKNLQELVYKQGQVHIYFLIVDLLRFNSHGSQRPVSVSYSTMVMSSPARWATKIAKRLLLLVKW